MTVVCNYQTAIGTHQGRLPNELAIHGMTDIHAANHYLQQHYMTAFNREFKRPAREQGSAFVPLAGINLDGYLCERHERVVGKDNCVRFNNLGLQILKDKHRYHYMKTKATVLQHLDGLISILHEPRKLAQYQANGTLLNDQSCYANAA